MTRRTASSVVGVGLLIGLLTAATFLPVPYVTMSPGPTVDVLSERQGSERVEVEGTRTYPTEGELRLTTVSVTAPDAEISIVEALSAWFDGTRAVYPRDVIYPTGQTPQDVERESAVQMVSSQDTAVAVALRRLGYELPLRTEVREVVDGSPADGRLRPGDVILEVAGEPIEGLTEVTDAVQASGVGEPTEFTVRRGDQRRTVTLEPEESDDDPGRAVVGVSIATAYDFPFEVDLAIDDEIGGPSAGLIFSLAIYDTLTPGSLIGGNDIAGTGTIDDEGRVGPIGGIQQKIVAAADAGAEVFLVPADNCDAALGADIRDDEIRLVRAETMSAAVDALEAYADDPDADLPSCE